MQIIQNWCCWGTDCCKCEFLHLTRNQNIKFGYISIIFILILIIGLVSKYKTISQTFISQIQCNNNQINQITCIKQKLTFIWLLALALMHLLIAFIVVLRNQVSKIFNQGVWIFKIVFVSLIGLFFYYFAPFGLINVLQYASAYMIPIWYAFQVIQAVTQSIIIIDMIYTADNAFKQIAEQYSVVHLIKALLSLLAVIGAVVINVLSYTNFTQTEQRLYVSILDSIEIGIYLIVVILRVVKGNNLFIYGMVMLYGNIFGYYMRYPASALSTTSFPSIQMCFVILSFIGILLPGSNKLRTKKSSLNEILALNTSKQDEDNRYVSSNKWVVFHLVFFMICLMITWVIYPDNQSFPTNPQIPNKWFDTFQLLRIIGWYMIIVFYFWTLITARLYPQQDFDQLENYFKEFELK